jgi:hypothetical protein
VNRLIHLLCICCSLEAFVLGCGKDDGPVKPVVPITPRIYHIPSAPESTVLNYAIAWERRDSTMIDTVLTDDYAGTSVDMTDPSPAMLTFTRADEVRAVGGIALDPNVSRVIVDLGTAWTLFSEPGDPPGWMTLQITAATISIRYTSYNDLSTHSTLEFKLKPIASGADSTWKIIRWSEVHN